MRQALEPMIGGGGGAGWNGNGRRWPVPSYGPGTVPPALREGKTAKPSTWFHTHAGTIILTAAIVGGIAVAVELHRKGVL